MRVEINYGRGKLTVELPGGLDVTVIAKRDMPTLHDPQAGIEAALSNPVGVPPLEELARGATTACILICDITRPVPNGLFLPLLIRRLMAAGMAAENITVLVATGLHRPNEGTELAELVGDPWVLQQVRVENHFATDDTAHVDLGRTATRGTVVRLDRRLVEADLKIATGLVEPHFMAGYSGGRKVIAPGVAHAETITTFHSARFMEHPRAANCVLDGNPLHEEQLEIMGMLGGALALNTVITEDRALSFVNFGEVVESHYAAVAHARAYSEVEVGEPFPTILTSAAGYPLGQNLLPDREGHGGGDGYPEAGRRPDHRLGVRRGHGLAPLRRGAAPPGRRRAGAVPGGDRRQEPRRHRRMADRDAAEADADRHHPPL